MRSTANPISTRREPYGIEPRDAGTLKKVAWVAEGREVEPRKKGPKDPSNEGARFSVQAEQDKL